METSIVSVTGPQKAEGAYKNIVLKSGMGFYEQTREENCIYHVKWDYDLKGNTINMPQNIVLKMEGGKISNGTLIGDNGLILYDFPKNKAFENVTLEGWKEGDTILNDTVKENTRDIESLDDEVARLEEIVGDREPSTALPSHMGRVTLPTNLVDATYEGWVLYKNTDNFEYLVYVKDDLAYIPYNQRTDEALINDGDSEFITHVPTSAAWQDMEAVLGMNYLQYTEMDVATPDGGAESLLSLNEALQASEIPYYGEGGTVKKNILIQSMINKPNTIYVIQYDFDLNGQTITVPENCVLKFEGGSLSGGTLVGQDTSIEAGLVKIFDTNVSIEGTWMIEGVYVEWFGAKANIDMDCSIPVNKIIETSAINKKIIFGQGTYKIDNPINLVGKQSILITGICSAWSPWRVSTKILASSTLSHVLKLVGDYTYGRIPTELARSITISNFIIDGNHNANIGINLYDAIIENCTIRNCISDGVVFEAMTYPAKMYNCMIDMNGGNGLYVKAPYTTCYSINGCEFNRNEGYGIFIEDGNTSTINDVKLQGNKRGGLSILKKRNESFTHPIFLEKITFVNLYTEANGSLDPEDSDYDGNYTLKIESLDDQADNPQTFLGKINSLAFISCTIYNNVYLIKGTSNTLLLNTNMSLDLEKNIPVSLGSIRLGSLKLGDFYNSPIDIIDIKKQQSGASRVVFLKSFGETEDFTNSVSVGNYSHIGLFSHYDGIIKISISEESLSDTSRLILKVPRTPTYSSIISNTVLGTGIYNGENIFFVRNTAMDPSKIMITKEDGTFLLVNELVNDSCLTYNLTFVSA